jgi:AcrR family transcriptional regulator
MATRRQPVETKRRTPRQTRSAETVASIVEAAAQILEKGGLAAFTTNAVAERAGVSIGTLYQYFADKNALVMALARGEM